MIFLRSAIFSAFFFATTFVLALGGALFSLACPSRTLTIPMLWARVVLGGMRVICGIRTRVIGAEHLPRQGAALIASAHQSAFDTMVWLTLVPGCCYVLKKELLRIPVFGWLIRRAHMIAVDRSGGGAALRRMLREADHAVAEGRQIVIFPEGTRAAPGERLPLQPGIIALAARTGLPVIPVATDSGHCWNRRGFFKYPGTIHIVVHPALPGGLPRDLLMEALEARIRSTTQRPGQWTKSVDNPVG